jgi:hypothetical protein
MSQQWSEFGSEQPSAESEANDLSRGNGANAEGVSGVFDEPVADPAAIQDEPADEATTTDVMGESSVTDATADVSAQSVEPAAGEGGSEFLAELVRAMQTTAGLERVRVGEDIERRRQTHIDGVRAREASEADKMRELASEDMKAIEAWVETETQRIQLERQRRATVLDEDLETSLSEHRSKIDREIEAVEKAIAAYRAEVDAYFDDLDRETDPILIAQQAAKRPVFPALETIAIDYAVPSAEAAEVTDATAAADTEPSSDEPPSEGPDGGVSGAGSTDATEPSYVGVMDPEAQAEPAESWAPQPETSPEPAPAGAAEDGDQPGRIAEQAEPVAAESRLDHGAGSLFQSVPVLRPMGWLWREANGGARSDRDG